jgi:hypothetical protein
MEGMHSIDHPGGYFIGLYDAARDGVWHLTQFLPSQVGPDSFCPTHPGGNTGPGVWGSIDLNANGYIWGVANEVADNWYFHTQAAAGGNDSQYSYYVYNTHYPTGMPSPPCALWIH